MPVKIKEFKYKGTDRQLFKMASTYEAEPKVTAMAGIDLSHLTAAEIADLKAELARHDAEMQRFMKAAYRNFKLSEMESDITEKNL